ncbi:LysM peptidoglycan-binding domain-containing protein [Calidifontibacter terrae]
MSAVTHLAQPMSTPAMAPSTRRPRRHLKLVPPLTESHASAGRFDGRDGGIRLTVRGRRMLVLVGLVAVLMAGFGVARAMAGPAAATAGVTVETGQTLSDVAHRAYPSLPISQAVVKVQLANGLNSLQVHAGQHLLLPR